MRPPTSFLVGSVRLEFNVMQFITLMALFLLKIYVKFSLKSITDGDHILFTISFTSVQKKSISFYVDLLMQSRVWNTKPATISGDHISRRASRLLVVECTFFFNYFDWNIHMTIETVSPDLNEILHLEGLTTSHGCYHVNKFRVYGNWLTSGRSGIFFIFKVIQLVSNKLHLRCMCI